MTEGQPEYVVPVFNYAEQMRELLSARETFAASEEGLKIEYAIYKLNHTRDYNDGGKIDSYYLCASVPDWYNTLNPCNLSQPCP